MGEGKSWSLLYLLVVVLSSVDFGFAIAAERRRRSTRNTFDVTHPNSTASYIYPNNERSDVRKNESLIEGWDLVEHANYPPPPSQTEDIEHWTRALFIDATKK